MYRNYFKYFFLVAIISSIFYSCSKGVEYKTLQKKDANGFTYEEVSNDPTGLRLYTLKNGLKVYLSKNSDEPKIQTYVAVRAGSVYDPADNTGLAHYLEHMLFKGSDKIASLNWEEEKKYLKQISDLYEEHKTEKDPVKKKTIYKKIDELSLKASRFAAANEYDKIVSSIGATGTNAHTWHEETVYQNKIPSNELGRWLKLESERFSNLVLRLFHTELEVVYEEFNRAQDNDRRLQHYALMDGLFPTHPYGQQSTIGKADHLKNPSMEAIHAYFNKFYIPNNMAVVLVGDLDFEKTIQAVNSYFGNFEKKELAETPRPKEKPIESPTEKEVFGPKNEAVSFGFRTPGISEKGKKYVQLADMILSNSIAGLIDLNLNQKQEVLYSGCYPYFFNDYGVHTFYGVPKTGQTLEEVKDLLLGEIEKLKKGEFDEWLIDAVVNDLKSSRIT